MLVLLGAWLFWLLINGRLQTYAGFVTNAGAGGIGAAFKNFSIPISLSGLGANLANSLPGGGGNTAAGSPQAGAGMPTFTGYQGGLPAGDTGIIGQTQGAVTGYYPSGLPTYSTLGALTGQATANDAGGAAGL